MSQYAQPASVSTQSVEVRAEFIVNTYKHLFGAILAFTGLEAALFATGLAPVIAEAMLSVNWLFILGAFMIVGWFGTRVAYSSPSKPAQYAALAAYVVAQALIFVPLLYIANFYAPGTIQSAAVVTLIGFSALTALVFWSRKDFSFLGSLLKWGFIVALVLIVAGVAFGFELGTFFSVGMIALAGGAILYDTSNILHHYPEDRYVAASLSLFASVALLFWYVLSLFLSRD
ncbi:MAG: Bax inhibitor-1 family protein [Bacteroidota bacterium]